MEGSLQMRADGREIRFDIAILARPMPHDTRVVTPRRTFEDASESTAIPETRISFFVRVPSHAGVSRLPCRTALRLRQSPPWQWPPRTRLATLQRKEMRLRRGRPALRAQPGRRATRQPQV